MKEITISRDDLFRSLQTASPLLAGKRGAGRVRIKSEKDFLHLFASRGDASVRTSLAHASEIEFDLHLPHRSLQRLAKAANENLTLKEEGGELVILSGERTMRLRGEDGEEYPFHPIPGEKKKFATFSGEELAEGLSQATRAASSDSSRPSLCSVCFTSDGKRVNLLSTDSYRLLRYPLQSSSLGNSLPSLLLPASVLEGMQSDLARVKPDRVDLFFWDEEGGGASFNYEEKEWNILFTPGEFPDHEKIIPKGGEVLALDKEEILGALRAVEAIQGGFKAPKAQSSVGALQISLKKTPSILLQLPGVGQMEEDLPKATWSGEEMKVGVHPMFLSDMLRVFSSDRVWGRVISPGDPLVFENDEGRLYLAMPVRLPDLERIG